MFCISINDATIKVLSGDYPLHQMVFVRSVIGIFFTLAMVQVEGGLAILRPKQPGLQALRAGLIVLANLLFFAALAVMPLATATAVFFVAPLFITLLAIPVLGETVGLRRLGAIAIGFIGVLVIMEPSGIGGVPTWAYALPVIAALCYAGMQVLTRKLAAGATASAMAAYIQVAFMIVSGLFWLGLGDGRFYDDTTSPAFQFLVRPWIWPDGRDWALFALLGVMAGTVGYCLSQAYRLGDAATISSFEYVALPLAIFWGWMIWGEVPALRAWIGIGLIMTAGLYVFFRQRQRSATQPATRPMRRI